VRAKHRPPGYGERSRADLPTDDSGTPDFEALGFAEGPTGIDVETVDDAGGDQ